MTAPIHAVTMPKWGIEMTEGTLNEWSVAEGAQVDKGDPLLEVETDKIVNTVESPAAGRVRRIVARSGETLPVGALVAVLADESASDADISAFITSFKGARVDFEPPDSSGPDSHGPDSHGPDSHGPDSHGPDSHGPDSSGSDSHGPGGTAAEVASAEDRGVDVASAATGAGTEEGGGDLRVSPIARRLAQRLGLDLANIAGTGRNGRISKEDVEQYAARLQQQPAAPLAAAADNAPRIVRMSATRLAIAKRLLESKQTIPHYRLGVDARVDALAPRRQQLATAAGHKITLTDLLVRATALALARHPALNSQLDGGDIKQYPHADVAIAVATELGLVTPVIRCADLKSVAQVGAARLDLVERARRGALTREDITGGTFTLSNLGMFDIDRFDAIINPPQIAILAVSAARERVVARDGMPAVARVMTLTLSVDHRVVDGAAAAAFLADLKALIEDPQAL